MSILEYIAGPWSDGRPSIHRQVVEALAARGADEKSSLNLAPITVGRITFVPGAIDSLAGRADPSPTKAGRLIVAINDAIRRPSGDTLARFYALLCEGDTITTVDELLSRLPHEIGDRQPVVATLARRLIEEAPDVEPVKAGVALLGLCGTADDVELISIVGHYEEITIYSVVALLKLLVDPEPAIWSLAKAVHGWGRIRAMPYLVSTAKDEIKDWMLREGFRNGIMNEYLAYTCAVAGNLHAALARHEIDDELLVASAELLSALINGGPAEDIVDYSDGSAVCVLFLRHMMSKRKIDIRVVDAVVDIKWLVEEERAAELHSHSGWSPQVLLEIGGLAESALRRAEVKVAVEESLRSADDYVFNVAAGLSSHVGVDSWPIRFERQRQKQSDQWYWLMQAEDVARIEQVLQLARDQLDLAKIAAAPSVSLGLGREYADDSALAFVLQELNRFPGVGSDLVCAGLRARDTRGRNMAINALRDWDRKAWPPNAMEELRRAAAREPDEKTRQRMLDLMQGELRN